MNIMYFLVKDNNHAPTVDEMSFLLKKAKPSYKWAMVNVESVNKVAFGFVDANKRIALLENLKNCVVKFADNGEKPGVFRVKSDMIEGAAFALATSVNDMSVCKELNLQGLFHAMGFSRDVMDLCLDAIYEHPEIKLYDFSARFNMKYQGNNISVPSQMVEDCYRLQEKYYIMSDAKQALTDLLDLPYVLMIDNKKENDEFLAHNQDLQNNYSAEMTTDNLLAIAEVATERFIDNHDSNMADNDQMENILVTLLKEEA